MREHIRAIITTTFTIFAMLFGAGNLMFPIRIGIESGSYTWLGFAGFAITGIVLPVIALLTIVTFQGDYTRFFGRLGPWLGHAFIMACMFVIGPFIAMPRIMTLSHEMLRPYIPDMPSWAFASIFATLVFLATYRPGRLLDIIGYILSPLKFLSIAGIVGIGLFSGYTPEPTSLSLSDIFLQACSSGYETLDVLGAIFFGSIIVKLLTEFVSDQRQLSNKEAVKVTGVAAMFAAALLSLVYLGMTYLGAFHGHGLEYLNEGQMFSHISYRVLGLYGAAFMGVTVFLACFTTTVTLAAVVGEYTQRVITQKQWPYAACVGSVLALCAIVASAGLETILAYSKNFIYFFYPLIIVTVLCNMLYKTVRMTAIRGPVLITAVVLCIYQFVIPLIGSGYIS